jgi:hypothetical protein
MAAIQDQIQRPNVHQSGRKNAAQASSRNCINEAQVTMSSKVHGSNAFPPSACKRKR